MSSQKKGQFIQFNRFLAIVIPPRVLQEFSISWSSRIICMKLLGVIEAPMAQKWKQIGCTFACFNQKNPSILG